MKALQAAAARLETGKTLDAGTHEIDEVAALRQVSEEDWPPDSAGPDDELLEEIEAVEVEGGTGTGIRTPVPWLKVARRRLRYEH
jgi:hypothetical protein